MHWRNRLATSTRSRCRSVRRRRRLRGKSRNDFNANVLDSPVQPACFTEARGGRLMVFAFDTLSFPRYLRDKGVPSRRPEAHADAVRQFGTATVVTKWDLT